MAYRPDNLYNTGIGNMNIGQVPVNNMQMAELTDKQKKFIDQKKFPLQEGLISPGSVYETITNPNLGVYDTGIFGIGAQEPTTKDEYNEYLKSIGISGQVSFLDDEAPYDFSGIQGQTAGLNIPLMVKAYLKKRLKYGAASTAANLALEAKAKAEAKKKADVAEEARRQQQLGAARSAADRKNIQQIQKYTGRSLSDYRMSRPSSERGFTGHGKSGMGRDPSDRMADGGLINFYR